MGILFGANGIKEIKEMYVGVDDTPRKVEDGYIGVDGVPKQFYSGISCDPVLNNNTWEQISQASKAGQAGSIWAIGDTKDIVINGTVGSSQFNNLTISAFILGFKHNEGKEGKNLTHFAIGKIGGKQVSLIGKEYDMSAYGTGSFVMNTEHTTIGGWEQSYMRKNKVL